VSELDGSTFTDRKEPGEDFVHRYSIETKTILDNLNLQWSPEELAIIKEFEKKFAHSWKTSKPVKRTLCVKKKECSSQDKEGIDLTINNKPSFIISSKLADYISQTIPDLKNQMITWCFIPDIAKGDQFRKDSKFCAVELSSGTIGISFASYIPSDATNAEEAKLNRIIANLQRISFPARQGRCTSHRAGARHGGH